MRAGFTTVEVDIVPHNLFKSNPNLLVKYMPRYARGIQNNYRWQGDEIYTPPYADEWGWTDGEEK